MTNPDSGSPTSNRSALPSTDDGSHFPRDQFVGRENLRKSFAKQLGYRLELAEHNGAEKWTALNEDETPDRDWAMVIEGHRGFGKSAFARWCETAPIKAWEDERNPTRDRLPFLAASASPDLCIGDRYTPLEAALYRLRLQILKAVGRAGDWADFGWRSSGEVLQEIATEAARNGYRSPTGGRGTVVFILDNVSVLPSNDGELHYADREGLGPAEKSVAGLLSEVQRLTEAEARPNIGIVVLAYPGFYRRVGQSLRSRDLFEHHLLEPLKMNDIATRIGNIIIASGRSDRAKNMAEAVFNLSSGIPILTQSIMRQAMQSVQSEGAQLSLQSIISVSVNPCEELEHDMIEQLRDRNLQPSPRTIQDRTKKLMQREILEELQSIDFNDGPMLRSEFNEMADSKADKYDSSEVKSTIEVLLAREILKEVPSDNKDDSRIEPFARIVWSNLGRCLEKMTY